MPNIHTNTPYLTDDIAVNKNYRIRNCMISTVHPCLSDLLVKQASVAYNTHQVPSACAVALQLASPNSIKQDSTHAHSVIRTNLASEER